MRAELKKLNYFIEFCKKHNVNPDVRKTWTNVNLVDYELGKQIFGNENLQTLQSNINKTIHWLEKFKMVKLCDGYYNPSAGVCKKYSIHFKKFDEYWEKVSGEIPPSCKEYYEFTEKTAPAEFIIFAANNIDKKKVKDFGPCRIYHTSDEEAREHLKDTFNQINYLEQLDTYLNDGMTDFHKRHASINITRVGRRQDCITKVGIRETSPYCQLKSRKKHPELPDDEWTREDENDKTFGKDNWVEIDMNASIHNLQRCLNYGLPIDRTHDAYEVMFKDLMIEYFGEWDRNAAKTLSMKVAFGVSPKKLISAVKWKTINGKKLDIVDIDYSRREKFEEFVQKAFEVYRKFTGRKNFSSTKVFLDESTIYAIVAVELRKKGIFFLQCYDGFYFEKGTITEDQFYDLVQSAIDFYSEHFYKTETSDFIHAEIMRNLIAELRVVYYHWVIEEMTVDEIAEFMYKPKSEIEEAIAKIKKKLGEE